jgi:hypothetical protein
MSLPPSPWPRRVALAHVGLVFLTWTLALTATSASDSVQAWPIIVALPWSLILLQQGGPLALLGIFCAGLLNSVLLNWLLGGSQRRLARRRRPLLLPPAA